MKRLIKFFVLTALLCLSAACSQTFENMNTTNPQKAQGRLVMSVGEVSRTLTPTISASSIKSAVLSANGKEIKTWDSKNQSVINKIENDSDILLDLGTYEFELIFYTRFDEILQIGKCNHEVTAGTNYITFNMQIAYSGIGNNYSVAQLYVKWEDTYKVDKVKAGLYDIETREVITYTDTDGKSVTCEETEEISAGKTNYSYIKTGVPPGQYLFKCELYYDENLLNTVIDVVKLIDSIGIADHIHINKLNTFYTITYQTDGTWNDGFVPTTLRPATAGVTLPTGDNITNGDCEFQGWYDEDGNKITEIPAGTIKDFVFTSKWKMTCTADTLLERLKNTKVGIYDIVVTGTMTESIITSINDSLYDKEYDSGSYIPVNRKNLKINLDLSQTTGLTSIPNRAFGKYNDNGNLDVGLTSLTGIVLPENVTTIKGYAFCGCTNLKSITIPPSVTTIESYAFRLVFDNFATQKYVERVYISDLAAWCNIKMYEQYPSGICEEKLANPLPNADLYLNGNLVTELVIPDGVTSIENYAFKTCNSITSVVIPASMTSIGQNAFYGCKNLTSVTFENTENWWIETNGIREADLTNPEQNADFLKNNEYKNLHVSTYTGVIMATADNVVSKLSTRPADSSYTVKLTGSITADTISSIAPLLQDNTKKVSLDLSQSNGLTSIAADAFYYCQSLTSIKLPNSITDIGAHAFDDCNNLISIDIPYGVKTIGHAAFIRCESLTSLIMPDSVTSLGKELQDSICKHYFCDICNVIRPYCENYSHIYEDKQYYCYGTELALFYRCPNLVTVEFSKNLTYMHNSDSLFYGCSNLTNVTLPSCLTSIGDGAFQNCKKLTSLIIHDGITYIGKNAFLNCSSLKNLTISNNITTINESTFKNCTALTAVTIPDGVTSIEASAFENCTALTAVTIPDSVTSIGNNVFLNCTNLKSVTIGSGLSSFYAETTFKGCTKLTTLTVSESNAKYKSSDNCIYSKDGTKFLFCAKGLTSVTIQNSVKSIGEYAFHNCTALTAVTIPDSVTTIGRNAFDGCSSLTSVTIPKKVTSIEDETFYGCSSLKSVTIGDSVTSIGNFAFQECEKLTSVTIPDSVTTIYRNAFYSCDRLKTVTIGSGVTKIDKFAFWACAAFSQYDSSVTFKDTSTWYRTSSSDYTGGTVVYVTDTHKNANNLSDSNNDSYYWYKTE